MTFSVEAHLPGSLWDTKRAPDPSAARALARRYRRRSGWRFIVIRDPEGRPLAAWIRVSVPGSRWRLVQGRRWLRNKGLEDRCG